MEGLWVKDVEQNGRQRLWGALSLCLRCTGMVGHLEPCSWTLERDSCQNWLVQKSERLTESGFMFALVLWVDLPCWSYGPSSLSERRVARWHTAGHSRPISVTCSSAKATRARAGPGWGGEVVQTQEKEVLEKTEVKSKEQPFASACSVVSAVVHGWHRAAQ